MTDLNDMQKNSNLSSGGLIALLQHWARGPESRAFPISVQILIAISALWIPIVLLTLFEGKLIGDEVAQPFVQDIVPNVRFLIAIPLLLIADRGIDPVVRTAISKLGSSGVVADREKSEFQAALSSLYRAKDSITSDIVIVMLAFGMTWIFKPGYGETALESVSTTWLWNVEDGEVRYSLAGWWYLLVSGPMFQVILFRWIWRFAIWAAFLYRVSRLKLALRPSHPDLAGGLGYLGTAQRAFVAVFFAFSTVASATIAHDLVAEGKTIADVGPEIMFLVILFTFIIYAPLLFFTKQFFLARRDKLYQYGALGYQLAESFDQKWVGDTDKRLGSELLASADPSAMADYTAAFDNVRSMRPVPTSPKSVVVTCGILLVPFLPLTLTMISLQDLFKRFTESLI